MTDQDNSLPPENNNTPETAPEEIVKEVSAEVVDDTPVAHAPENNLLRELIDSNFIEYASYVIKERAIPDVDDGLKPVQRRILWSLLKMHDGKFHKVANVIGFTMQFHPHGDASIGDALVVLANKEFFIEKQGNFGNLFTGDVASAARYIECRLKPFATEVLPNNDLTEFVDSYDGRNKEPVCFPAKVPALLMLGADGIAVGMSTTICPHNFRELLEAQLKILRGESFQVFPDFPQGGTMDVSEYEDGNGRLTLRAKIDIVGRKLVIREIPATTNTEKLIGSIERAAAKGKIKIASVSDFTTDVVEIEVTPMRGYDPKKALNALYAYTDCSLSVSPNMIVIKENRPVQMNATEVLIRNTAKLQEYLRRELELELAKLQERFHDKTLVQIFIENRIYKRIEECESYEEVLSEVHIGLNVFRHMLRRDVTNEDIERLLAIPIRRISLFDMNKNKRDLDDILAEIDQIQKHLKRIKKYTMNYIQNLLDKHGHLYPRKTEIETFEKIDLKAAALSNVKVGWDRKNGYIGSQVKSDEPLNLTEYDYLFCLTRDGSYKIITIPEKTFVGRLYYFTKFEKGTEYGIMYSDKKTGKWYAKRVKLSKFITDKDYTICPEGCRLELITSRPNSRYELKLEHKRKTSNDEPLAIDLLEFPLRSAKARGQLVASKPVSSFKFLGLSEQLNSGDALAAGNSEQGHEEEEIEQDEAAVEKALIRAIKKQFKEDAEETRLKLNPNYANGDIVEQLDTDCEEIASVAVEPKTITSSEAPKDIAVEEETVVEEDIIIEPSEELEPVTSELVEPVTSEIVEAEQPVDAIETETSVEIAVAPEDDYESQETTAIEAQPIEVDSAEEDLELEDDSYDAAVETEAVEEPSALDTPVSAPETTSTEQTSEHLFDLSEIEEDKPEEQAESAHPTQPPQKKKDGGDDDTDWGISQPELFGF